MLLPDREHEQDIGQENKLTSTKKCTKTDKCAQTQARVCSCLLPHENVVEKPLKSNKSKL
jgi:hypothetical protein